MKKDRTIAALLRRHRNENVHTEFVARLALQIFDETAEQLKLDPRDRKILEAAARLHDIGFAAAPAHHVARSAQIVLQTPVHGFAREERRLIAGILLLHSGDFREQFAQHRVFKNWPGVKRAQQLGAILRIADALDHGHVQDVRIRRIRVKRKGITVKVSSLAFPGNLEAARRKADAWREVFETPLCIVGRIPKKLETPLQSGDTVVEALRKLLFLDYRYVAALGNSASDAPPDKEDLHQARVVLRRSATLLRYFSEKIRSPLVSRIQRRLIALSRETGDARDATVWNELLEKKKIQRVMRNVAGWREFVAEERDGERAIYAGLAGVWARPQWRAAGREFALLLRADLANAKHAGTSRTIVSKFLRTQFKKISRKRGEGVWNNTNLLHKRRRQMRRLRYVADSFAPLLPKKLRRCAGKMHEEESKLGQLHDLYVAVLRLRGDTRPVAIALAKVLAQFRDDCRRKFDAP